MFVVECHFETLAHIDVQSPTTSVPEYLPSTSSSSINESPSEERITLLVTTDAEHLVTVDVSGARYRNAAFIRERIFAKVSVERFRFL